VTTPFDIPIVLKNGSLEIRTVRGDDTGLYTCTYERDGLADVASAQLTVVVDGMKLQ